MKTLSEYYVGLDIGTDSVGWAVTDQQYQVVKKNGKALWGIRLFEEAQKAEERRTFRTSRRRLERRKQRLSWLQQVFSGEIAKADPAFFQRLKESKFLEGEKEDGRGGKLQGRYTLFADHDYNDQDYMREFPTIYHLRQALLTQDRAFDVRLVYLAIHHIMKNRGHFLFGDLKLEDVTAESCMKELDAAMRDLYELEFKPLKADIFTSVLKDRSIGITAKKKALKEAYGAPKEDVQCNALLDLLAGASVDLKKLFALETEDEEIKSISLKEELDSKEAALTALLGDGMQLLNAAKALYDWALLDELRAGKEYLSSAKIETYEKHRADMIRLKRIVRAIGREQYNQMFRRTDSKLNNYPAYSGHGAAGHRCTYDDFRKYVKKVLSDGASQLTEEQKQEAAWISGELAEERFLPKQTGKDNGVIPHQLHEKELRDILSRAEKYLPFLTEKDESGLTRSQQIVEVFRFRIPYYVGPLKPLNSKSDHAWLVRNGEKIMPWNFERVVDLSATAENFITRMTAKCSYIGKDVLPKDALIYTRFTVLNELNNLKINGKPIPVELKQSIYQSLFLRFRKVTRKRLTDYLLSEGAMQKGDLISGIDGDFKSSLGPWLTFASLLRDGEDERMIEDVIRHIVLFGEDRKLLENWLSKTYGARLTKDEQRYIMQQRKKFSGWGQLSREFLTEITHTDPETGEICSIMDMLWNTNENLMELLSGRYTFAQGVEAYRQKEYADKQTLDDVLKESYASPGIRRAIHQTIAIMSEVEKITGGKPKRIFVEMARSEEEKGDAGRKASRKQQLQKLYERCGEDERELRKLLETKSEADLRRGKLYLYFTQLGKCMYSGEPINLSALDSDYDIDHIYPQSKVKDDSLDNRVLVKRRLNAEKSDRFPLPADIRQRMLPLWRTLREKGFISEKKFSRLTRREPFTENELSDFIARQLVETRQSTKLIAELLQKRYGEETEIVYVKAGNVSAFRQDQRLRPDGAQCSAWEYGCGSNTVQDPLFVKCREVNDFHHAKDAYLNIVVGNVYHVKFTKSPLNFIRSHEKYSMNSVFAFDVERGGETAWRRGNEGTIATVRRMMRKNNVLFTRRSYRVEGIFYNKVTIQAAGKGKLPIKTSDPRMKLERFGGYITGATAFFCLVEHTKNKKRTRSLEHVLVLEEKDYLANPAEFAEKEWGLKSPVVIIPCIKLNSLICINGVFLHISGIDSENQNIYNNAHQLILPPEWNQYVKRLGKLIDRNAENNDEAITRFDGVSDEKNLELYDILCERLVSDHYWKSFNDTGKLLLTKRNEFMQKGTVEQCRILTEVLKELACNAVCANLKVLSGSGREGRIRNTKYLDQKSTYFLHNPSVTGFFDQVINLSTCGVQR